MQISLTGFGLTKQPHELVSKKKPEESTTEGLGFRLKFVGLPKKPEEPKAYKNGDKFHETIVRGGSFMALGFRLVVFWFGVSRF